MAINIFEGARRIAKLIAVFIVIGFGIAIITDNPRTANVSFTIPLPGEPPVLGCGPEGGNVETKSKYTETRRGNGFELTLCFRELKPSKAQKGNSMLPSGKAPFDPDAYLASGEKRKFVELHGDSDGPWKNYQTEQVLIPYSVDKATGIIWFDTKSSPVVSQYMSKALDTFQIPETEEARINNLWWSNKLELAGMYFLGMIGTLAGWWALIWTVGWIMRGFMGIPVGSDSRE